MGAERINGRAIFANVAQCYGSRVDPHMTVRTKRGEIVEMGLSLGRVIERKGAKLFLSPSKPRRLPSEGAVVAFLAQERSGRLVATAWGSVPPR